jgi:hypothetical protein
MDARAVKREPRADREAQGTARQEGARRRDGVCLGVQGALHKQGPLLGPRQRTETALSLAAATQPRTQDGSRNNETPRSRCTQRSYSGSSDTKRFVACDHERPCTQDASGKKET